MRPPIQTFDFLLRGLQAHLPFGRAFTRRLGSNLTTALSRFIPSYQRLVADADALLADSFPATAVYLLPEWEATVGLPDPCAGEAPTLFQRQTQVVARLAYSGGQSVPFLVSYAAALGYAVTVEEFVPADISNSSIGDPINGEAWAFALRIHAPAATVAYADVGSARVGDPLATFGNGVLECELRAVCPAHVVITFAYS